MFIPLYDKNKLINVRLQYVTIGLILLNLLIFLITTSGTGGLVLEDYAVAFGFRPGIFADAGYGTITLLDPIVLTTPLSYAFLHGDWMHLLGNMAFLWVFGDNIEDATGHFRYLVFYCLCAMGAALAHMLVHWDSQISLIGASGATSGIIAAYLMLHPDVRVWILILGRIPLPVPALYCLGAWLFIQLVNSLTDAGQDIAWWAHVGGAITGAMLIPFMKHKSRPLFQRSG